MSLIYINHRSDKGSPNRSGSRSGSRSLSRLMIQLLNAFPEPIRDTGQMGINTTLSYCLTDWF